MYWAGPPPRWPWGEPWPPTLWPYPLQPRSVAEWITQTRLFIAALDAELYREERAGRLEVAVPADGTGPGSVSG